MTFCNICPIKIKKYFNINQVKYILDEFIDSLNYRIRRFYFIPLKCSYSKILFIFSEEEYKKCNYKKKSTVNFRIVKTMKPDVYRIIS